MKRQGLIAILARHRLLANLLMLLIFGMGAIALTRMNIQFFPTFALDVVTVRVIWSGASAEDVENGIVIPLEERLKTVDGLKRLTATASQGIAALSLELHEDTDPLLALDQARQRVDEFRNLPKDAETPQVSRVSRYDPVVRLLVSGPSLSDLRPWVRQFERELLARGIDRVEISGLPEERIAIEVPGRALETLGLSLDGIGQQVARLAQDLPSGVAGEADGAREIRGLELRRAPMEFEDLALVSDERGLVRLGDVATIVREARPASLTMTEVETESARSHGAVTVEMLLQRAENGHSLRAARLFDEWYQDTKTTLPPSLELVIFDEQWEPIRERIDLLVSNGLMGFVLVLVLLFVFLPGRVAFWVAVGIPTSYLLALTLLWAFGGSINMISLFGLLLTLGIINDDAIVVGEHAETRSRLGMPPAEAAIAGARRMFWPVVAAALTTVAAFLPLMLVRGIMGNILGDIPFVAIMVLMASLFEVFLIMPAHLRGAFSHQVQRAPPRWRQRVDAGFDHFRDRIYRPLVRAAVHRRGVTIAGVLALMILSAGLLAGGRVSFVFFPTPESQMVFANVTFVAGTPRARTQAFLDELALSLARTEADLGGGLVEAAVARLGSTVSRTGAAAKGDQLASILVQLVPSEDRSVRNEQFLAAWRERVPMPAGIESLVISARKAGPPGRDINVRLTGEDAATLKSAALDLAQGLESVSGVSDMTDDMPYGREQLIYRVSATGQALGVTTELLGRQLRAAFDGHLAQLVQVGQDELEVRVLLPRSERERLDALERLNIRLADETFVPLDTVADWETRRGFEALRHADGQLAVEVTADVDRAQNTSDKVYATLERDLLPDLVERYGVAYSFEGRAADQRETMGDMRTGVFLGLGLIFIVLAAIFSSWGWPLVVMTAIPLGLVGAIIGHWVVGIDLTILSLFGLFGLSGIVVNNAIILVSMYQEQLRLGLGVEAALVEAACSRLRAMFLTSATTVAGLVPLLFETSMQAQFLIPMAVSLAFGIGFATVLVLIFTPALLAAHETWHARLRRWFGPKPEPATGI